MFKHPLYIKINFHICNIIKSINIAYIVVYKNMRYIYTKLTLACDAGCDKINIVQGNMFTIPLDLKSKLMYLT